MRAPSIADVHASGGRVWFLAVLGAALVACFARLGREPVLAINEAREGVYARAMIESSNWILPEVQNHVENGERIPDKPPLHHWIAASAAWARAILSGRSEEGPSAVSASFDAWSLRFPSALAGCATVLGILALGGRIVGRRAAQLGAAALVSSWQFVNEARYGRVDMLFACCTTWAMLLAGIALLEGSASALLGAAAAAGLAVLAKGPLGLFLPVLAGGVAGFCLPAGDRPSRPIARLPWVRAALVFFVVAAPWYAAAWRLGGTGFLRSQLLNENVGQFSGANGRMPIDYYLGPWLADSWPWNLAAVVAAVAAVRTKHRGALYCLVWWAAFLLVFQISAYKRGAYLLPALPAGSLLAGVALDAWIARGDRAGLPARPLPGLAWLATALGVGLAGAAIGRELATSPACVRWIGRACGPGNAAIAVGSLAVVLFAASGAVRALYRRDARGALARGFAAQLALFVGGFTAVLADKAEATRPSELAARVESSLRSSERCDLIGIQDDPSLLLLFHARDPQRFAVHPTLAAAAAGGLADHALFALAAWESHGHCRDRDGWQELFRGELRERAQSIPVVFARRGADLQ